MHSTFSVYVKLIYSELHLDLPRQVVSSSKPSEEGAYWGYRVRYAHNISSVFKDCSYKVSSPSYTDKYSCNILSLILLFHPNSTHEPFI